MSDTNQGPTPTSQPAPPSAQEFKQSIVASAMDNRMNTRFSVEEMAAWLVSISSPHIWDARIPFTLVPDGVKAIDFEKHMPEPRMIRKDVKFIDTPSFVSYFNLFKNSYMPRLFTKKDGLGMVILCVYDYDAPGNDVLVPTTVEGETATKTSMPQPKWNKHLATLSLAFHPDYKELRDLSGKWQSQDEFSLFIEANTHLFKTPDGATMLELAQDLKGVRNANWQSGKRLANGQVALSYIETIEAKSTRGEITVPEYLIMSSPIFDGYDPQDLKAAFSWTMDGNKVKFMFRLLTKLAEREAQDAVKVDVVKQTGLNLHHVSTFDGIVSKDSANEYE